MVELSNSQNRVLRETGKLLLVQRVDPQPHKTDYGTYTWLPRTGEGTPCIHAGEEWTMRTIKDASPLGPPGSEHGVGESFYCDEGDYSETQPLPQNPTGKTLERLLDTIYYHTDGECCSQIPECACAEVGPVVWRPAETLPEWAIRTRVVVESVEVKPAGDITDDEAISCGVTMDGAMAGIHFDIDSQWVPDGPRRMWSEFLWPHENPNDLAWFTMLRRMD